MTKVKINTYTQALAELTNLKLSVINFHKGEENTYLRIQTAKDACYTSNNSIRWKLEQMSKLKAEIAALFEQEGQEVADVNVAKKLDIYDKMNDELTELQLRHDADLTAYHTVTGDEWTIRPKSTRTNQSQAVNERVAKLLAS
tara:strand:- start:813 stop:1241 length:429 start_codon:yes stop_codon:yes gene_type:complete